MIRRLWVFLLVCSLLLLSSGICSAREYMITDQELTRLETIFQQLELNNKTRLATSEKVKQDLKSQRIQLEEYQKELEELRTQLRKSSLKSDQAMIKLEMTQVLLKNANESLDKLEREMRSKNRKLTFQRDFLFAGLIWALVK